MAYFFSRLFLFSNCTCTCVCVCERQDFSITEKLGRGVLRNRLRMQLLRARRRRRSRGNIKYLREGTHFFASSLECSRDDDGVCVCLVIGTMSPRLSTMRFADVTTLRGQPPAHILRPFVAPFATRKERARVVVVFFSGGFRGMSRKEGRGKIHDLW